MQYQKSYRFALLDIVRVVAVTCVIIAHIGQATGNPVGRFFGIENFYWVSLGGVGVTVFIILSGLVLQLSYGHKNTNYGQFMSRRVLRIYPVYWMCLLIAFFVYLVKLQMGSSLPPLGTQAGGILCSITGFCAFTGNWGGPFLATGWFIGLIMCLYLLFPFLSKCINRRPHISILAMLTISVVSRAVLGQYDILPNRPLDWFPLCRLFEFGLGIYLIKVARSNIWSSINLSGKFSTALRFLAELSFPIFLVHITFIDIISWPALLNITQVATIGIFLAVSIICSVFVFRIDQSVVQRNITL